MVRRQTSRRKRAADQGKATTRATIKKRPSKKKQRTVTVDGPQVPTYYNQKYNSSDTCQLVGLCALREQRALDAGFAEKRRSRASQQLTDMGKLKTERKLRASIPEAFRDGVPEGHSFTCVSVFESLLQGEFSLLYGLDGRSRCDMSAAAAPVPAPTPTPSPAAPTPAAISGSS